MFESAPRRSRRGLQLLVFVITAAIMAIVVIGASRSIADDAKKPATMTDQATVKVDDVLAKPEAYLGKTVTLTGEVEEVASARAFALESGLLGLGKGLLVVGKSEFPAAADLKGGLFVNDDHVKVTGVVRKLVVADVEKELGWDLDTEWETKFKERPVIIAENVTKLPK